MHYTKRCSWTLLWTAILTAFPTRAAPGRPASSNPDTVARAVVQLLAIGPAEQGINQECSATGFLINEEGYILTNAHVYDRARDCLAASPAAKIMAKLGSPKSRVAAAASCDLVALDRLHDLAVIKAERPLATEAAQRTFALLAPSEVEVGTPVKVTGHPTFAWNPVTQSGKLVRFGTLGPSGKSAETIEVIVLDIALERGSSGSPVYLPSDGGVIGIVDQRNPSRPSETLAIPVRYGIELLERSGVRWYPVRN